MLHGVLELSERILWSIPMLCLFLLTGLYFTVRTGFLQCRIPFILRRTLFQKSKESQNGISPLRTLSTALGACMGTGNIAGVGTALLMGGPGALFWMCVSAFFGMMTSFAETVLAVKFRRQKENGENVGGAMYVLSHMGLPKMGKLYAFLLTVSSFGIGNMAQVNASAMAVQTAFSVSPIYVGVFFGLLIAVTMAGGIHRISRVTEKAVPLLSGIFLLSAVGAVYLHRSAIPTALHEIVSGAFGIRTMMGGVTGYGVRKTMRIGITRGVFSNEAGLGSTAVIHAASNSEEPVEQGMWGIVEVFLDTVLMCLLTGLVILTSGVSVQDTDGASLFSMSLAASFGRFGEILTAVTLMLLGFASLTGWSYCGERGMAFLFGEKRKGLFRILYALAAVCGSFLLPNTVFRISDVLNALMALPNLLSLWMCSGTVIKELQMYKRRQDGSNFPKKHKGGAEH